jgi:predicted nucleic-acid-binding Zn-ribbon protein
MKASEIAKRYGVDTEELEEFIKAHYTGFKTDFMSNVIVSNNTDIDAIIAEFRQSKEEQAAEHTPNPEPEPEPDSEPEAEAAENIMASEPAEGASTQTQRYTCPKCGGHEFEDDQFQATGGNISKLLNVQNKRFITITCTNCGYTEIYRHETSSGMDILDFLTGL